MNVESKRGSERKREGERKMKRSDGWRTWEPSERGRERERGRHIEERKGGRGASRVNAKEGGEGGDRGE